jgi:hypothetical protein
VCLPAHRNVVSRIAPFPYQHLIAASLSRNERGETLRLKFSFHDVEIEGNNLRALLVALQDFAVKWVRVMPERYPAARGW